MDSILMERESTVASPPAAPRPRRKLLLPITLGVIGAVVSFLGSWIPSYWGDEAASVMSAERSIPSLFAALQNVDAVHGTYYLFLHFWIQLFGASELSVRFPSAVAAGAIVAGTVVLARTLFGPKIALIAGIVCLVLPRLTSMGAEGRSYAMASAVAVWLMVLFLGLLRRNTTKRRPWLAYSALLALGLYLFLYICLILLVFGGIIATTRAFRPMARRWVEATALGVLLAAPVVLTGIREHGQIAFLARRNYATFAPIAVQQWFGNPALAVLSWLLIVVAVVVAMRRRDRSIVPMVLWLLVPMAALLAVDKFITPTYSERYLSFCVPAAATLIALGIGALRKNWLMVVALASVIALAAPSYLQQRGPYGKDSGSDLRQVAQIVGSHASPGDAVVFDEAIKPSRKPRLALHLYPEDFVGLIDVGLRTSYVDRAGLWDSTLPVTAVGDRLASTTVVWALESSATSSPRDILDLKALGFVVHATYQSNRTTVYELRRDPS